MRKNNINIPNGWSIKKLGECFFFSAGGDVDKACFSEIYDDQHPYPIYANALTNKGLYGYSSKYKIVEDCITITGRGDIGKVFYRKKNFTPIVRLIVAIPNENINAKFMSYACSQIHFFNETTGVPQLTVPQVKLYKIVVPPFAEQEKIGEILSCWDKGIEKIDSIIKLKERQKKGLMQKLLTGKHRLKGFSSPWKEVKLGDICKIMTAKSKSANINDEGRYIIVDMGAVSSECRMIANKKTNNSDDILEVGDVIMPKDDIGGGNIIGKTIIIKDKDTYVLSDHVFRLKIQQNLPIYISYSINKFETNKYMRRMSTGSAILGLSKKDVNNCNIYIPTDIKEQEAIANILQSADKEIDLLQKKLDYLKKQKSGLMQVLLSGKIRVRV